MMSLPPSPSDKAALRRALLERRQHISESDRARWNASIAFQLERFFESHPVAALGVFLPIRHEPDLSGLYAKLTAQRVSLLLPVVVSKNQPLRFAAWEPGDKMTTDAFGVPVPAQPILLPLPEALIVPCVGFNGHGFRLGYGGGFYDRTLAQKPRPLAIGVAYSCQQAVFDVGLHDIALDMIVTES